MKGRDNNIHQVNRTDDQEMAQPIASTLAGHVKECCHQFVGDHDDKKDGQNKGGDIGCNSEV